MHATPTAWWNFGYYGVFVCVFLEQIGVPVPAFPAMLAAGALVASGDLNLFICLLTAMAAALLADGIWYTVGRIQGGKILNLMCRVSWRPDTCVSKTKSAFSQYGHNTLLFSKFVPGLSTLASPLSGMTQLPAAKFFLYDAAGTAIWGAVLLLGGSYLQDILLRLLKNVVLMEGYLPWAAGGLILAVLLWRYLNRRYYLNAVWRGLRDGVSVDNLKQRMDQGEDLVILDVRHALDAPTNPVTLPRACWIPHNVLPERYIELPLEKPIIVYCDCPQDVGAVMMVGLLRKLGAQNARPLRGGLGAWMARGYVTEPLEIEEPMLLDREVTA